MLVLSSQSWSLVKLVSLIDDFLQKQEKLLRFTSKLDNITTHDTIHKYQVNINNVIMYLNYVYGCCNRFIYLFELKIIPTDNLVVATVCATSILGFD